MFIYKCLCQKRLQEKGFFVIFLNLYNSERNTVAVLKFNKRLFYLSISHFENVPGNFSVF